MGGTIISYYVKVSGRGWPYIGINSLKLNEK